MSETRWNPKVDEFLRRETRWREAFERLRAIILDFPLAEELKWGVPCYTYENKNVVLIHGFKEYCAILFVKGALLPDPHGVLVQQTENVQSARQIRFRSVAEIDARENMIREYLQRAIEVEKAGLKVDFSQRKLEFPEELEQKFAEDPAFKAAFLALTPGRQRAYVLYFSQPKLTKTRLARIEKCAPRILAGKGLND